MVHGSRGDIVVDIITLAMAKAAASGGGSGGDMHVTGNLQVDGNITQSGSSYETHAEKVYTKDDYIVTRDGAVSGLASGDFSGFQVKKYDGTNDGRLVVDSDGTARVGDVGDEQPLLTRAETADLVNGAPLVWDATNLKAISGSAGGGNDPDFKTRNNFSDLIYYYVEVGTNTLGNISTDYIRVKETVVIVTFEGIYSYVTYLPKGNYYIGSAGIQLLQRKWIDSDTNTLNIVEYYLKYKGGTPNYGLYKTTTAINLTNSTITQTEQSVPAMSNGYLYTKD